MNMESEYECKALVNGKQIDVVATYDVDYPDVLLYGVFELADPENDLTEEIGEAEFDRIYSEISAKVAEDMSCEAESYCEGER